MCCKLEYQLFNFIPRLLILRAFKNTKQNKHSFICKIGLGQSYGFWGSWLLGQGKEAPCALQGCLPSRHCLFASAGWERACSPVLLVSSLCYTVKRVALSSLSGFLCPVRTLGHCWGMRLLWCAAARWGGVGGVPGSAPRGAPQNTSLLLQVVFLDEEGLVCHV